MNEVVVSREIARPVEQVWARYTDHAGWSSWAGLGRVKLVRAGEPTRDGVGAVRAFSSTPGLLEEVVTFEAPHLLQYKVTRGPLPFDRHLGEVSFDAVEAGTRVTWRVSFRSRLPGLGWILERGLSTLFRRILAALDRDLSLG